MKATMTSGDLAAGGGLQPTQGVPKGLQNKIGPPAQRFMVKVKAKRRRKKRATG